MNTCYKEAIEFSNVSKFYGDVLGVNRITFSLGPGITGLVGPNGAGKSTLMSLMAGLMKPSNGHIRVLGRTLSKPEIFFRQLGYCTQYDSFPAGTTGYRFIRDTLRVHGYLKEEAKALTRQVLEKVDLLSAANRCIDAYSKGMRQRIKLAQSICHAPKILILDEPLNGLDPIARTLVIELFQELAHSGMSIVISSHILHEVELISDNLVMIKNGYLMADGDAAGIQSETGEPMKVYIRSVDARKISSKILNDKCVIEVQLHKDELGLFVCTTDADLFFLIFNELVVQENWTIESISPADETVEAIYRHLIAQESALR